MNTKSAVDCPICVGRGGWPDPLRGGWVDCKLCVGTGREDRKPLADLTPVQLETYIAEERRRMAADPRSYDTTILHDENYWTGDRVAKFKALYDAHPEIRYIRVMTQNGKELLIFNGEHPTDP